MFMPTLEKLMHIMVLIFLQFAGKAIYSVDSSHGTSRVLCMVYILLPIKVIKFYKFMELLGTLMCFLHKVLLITLYSDDSEYIVYCCVVLQCSHNYIRN